MAAYQYPGMEIDPDVSLDGPNWLQYQGVPVEELDRMVEEDLKRCEKMTEWPSGGLMG